MTRTTIPWRYSIHAPSRSPLPARCWKGRSVLVASRSRTDATLVATTNEEASAVSLTLLIDLRLMWNDLGANGGGFVASGRCVAQNAELVSEISRQSHYSSHYSSPFIRDMTRNNQKTQKNG